MIQTLGQLIGSHGFDVLDYLDRDTEIPGRGGLQFQGDLAIIPVSSASRGSAKGTPVTAEGIAVIPAAGSGHEHRLFAGTPGTAVLYRAASGGQEIGTLECTQPAYVAHPEHAYTGIAPGSYILRRQREQAQEERIVAD
jgi:hypothetical protein